MILFIWSKSSYVFLEDLVNKKDKIALSYKNLLVELNNTYSFEAILIEVELEWEGYDVDDFYGFNIAVELRTKFSQKCPIILCSCLSADVFRSLALNQVKYNILFGRGTDFVELRHLERQIITECIEEVESLNDATLTDVSEMLCNLKGLVVDKLTHDLKYDADIGALKEILKKTSQYLSQEQLLRVNYEDFSKQLLVLKSCSQKVDFERIKHAFVTLCSSELAEVRGNIDYNRNDNKYKILILEDDLDFKESLEDRLGDDFNIISTSDSQVAIDHVRNDERNEILAIISDWRLYKPNSRYWQKQGYEVLEYAAKMRYIALFSLTSEADFNVHNIRNLLKLDIYLTKKQYLVASESWNLFIEKIKYECEKINYLISHIPRGKDWYKNGKHSPALNFQYIQKRNSVDWKIYESNISQKANKLWAYYKQMLGRDLSQTTTVTNWKDKFGISFSPTEPDLRIVLVARRVFLALWFSAEDMWLAIHRTVQVGSSYEPVKVAQGIKIRLVTHGETWEDDYLSKHSNDTDAYKDLEGKANSLAGKVCIIASELPDGILPEEQAWLKSHGIDSSKNSTPDSESYESDMDDEIVDLQAYSKKREDNVDLYNYGEDLGFDD